MKTVLKWTLRVVGAVVALALVAAGVLWYRGGSKLALTGSVAVPPLALPDSPEALARGAHLAAIHCAECHGKDYGGQPLIDDPSFMILDAPNLTRGGVGATLAPEDWDRAIRHGLGSRGNALFIMPSAAMYHLEDADVGAIAAHLRSVPPVDRTTRPRAPAPIARFLIGAGVFDQEIPFAAMDHDAPRTPRPAAGVSAELGSYLILTVGCRQCHGPDLAGEKMGGPGEVVAANLTPAGPIGAWNEELFLKMVAERQSEHMPWGVLRAMSEEEQRSVWRFLSSLPPKASPPA
jgi:mono/diheme cytochrome c family protein